MHLYIQVNLNYYLVTLLIILLNFHRLLKPALLKPSGYVAYLSTLQFQVVECALFRLYSNRCGETNNAVCAIY